MNEFRRYLFLFDAGGRTYCGSDWLFGTELTQDAALLRHANRLLKVNPKATEVWLMPYYTQAMCEMEPRDLDSHVKKNGRLITSKK